MVDNRNYLTNTYYNLHNVLSSSIGDTVARKRVSVKCERRVNDCLTSFVIIYARVPMNFSLESPPPHRPSVYQFWPSFVLSLNTSLTISESLPLAHSPSHSISLSLFLTHAPKRLLNLVNVVLRDVDRLVEALTTKTVVKVVAFKGRYLFMACVYYTISYI